MDTRPLLWQKRREPVSFFFFLAWLRAYQDAYPQNP